MDKKKKDSGLVHIDTSSSVAFINGESVTDADIYHAVDAVIEQLKETKDLQVVDGALGSLLTIQKFSIFGIAKMLHGVKHWWDDNNWDEETGDTFEDRFYSSHGLNPVIMDRYISVWEYRSQMPEKIHSRPLKDQIAIAATLSEGYEIPKQAWRELEKADSNSAVLKILREIKGKAPRKSSMMLYLERNGNLSLVNSDGEKKFVGLLNVKEEKGDDDIRKAISRYVNNTGTIRR